MCANKIVFTFIFFGITHFLAAQTDKKQSLSISFHPATLYQIKESGNENNNVKNIKYEAVFGEYGYKAVGYDEEFQGAWALSYKRYLTDHFRINLSMGCEFSSKHWELYDIPDAPRSKRIFDYRFGLLPGIDWLYVNHEHYRMYSAGQAGIEWVHRGLAYFDGAHRDRQNFAWQIWGFCWEFQVLPSLNLGFGIGYGTLGILKGEISYGF